MGKGPTVEYDHRKDHRAYLSMKEALQEEHDGKTALLHNGEIVSIEDHSGEAYRRGCDRFSLGNFSLEEIGQKPLRLGIAGMNF